MLGVLVKELIDRGKLVALACFTGKASSVLGRKLKVAGVESSNKLLPRGNKGSVSGELAAKYFLGAGEGRMTFCGTIHRLIYKPIIDEETDEVIGFQERGTLDREYDVIILDEASMVGREMLEKLQKFQIPILAVGDHGQLPPVMDVSTLMLKPDLRLERIHRQALGSPIIALSKVIRETGRFDTSLADGAALEFASKASLEEVVGDAYSQARRRLDVGLLCWMNKTRVKLNMTARRVMARKGPPGVGEVLICLRNMTPVYNGMRGVVKVAAEDDGRGVLNVGLSFPEEGLPMAPFKACAFQFNRDKSFAGLEEIQQVMPWVKRMKEAGSLFDFGYAMTTHRSQGSSFRHVIFNVDMPQNPNDDMFRRLAYTAVTRASEKLTVVT